MFFDLPALFGLRLVVDTSRVNLILFFSIGNVAVDGIVYIRDVSRNQGSTEHHETSLLSRLLSGCPKKAVSTGRLVSSVNPGSRCGEMLFSKKILSSVAFPLAMRGSIPKGLSRTYQFERPAGRGDINRLIRNVKRSNG